MISDSTLPALARTQADGSLEFIILGYLARYPERTRKLYSIHLRQWFEFCASLTAPIHPLEAKRAHIEAYGRYLTEQRKIKNSTAKHKIQVICGLYKFATIDGYLTVDPGAHVRRPKVEFMSTTRSVTRPQSANLMAAAKKDGPRTFAIMSVLLYNGLRLGELLAADVEHLGMSNGYHTIHLPNRKGGKIATLGLAPPTAWALHQYLAGRTSGPLFLGDDGQRLRAGVVRRVLRKLCTQIGLEQHITPHGLRHTFVTLARDAGASDRDIMASTSHTDARMLHYYDRSKSAIERNATFFVVPFVGAA